MNLFEDNSGIEKIVLPMPDAVVSYYPNFYNEAQALLFQEEIKQDTLWQEDDIKLFGKVYKQPRLTALYGDSDKPYRYSNIQMTPNQWTPTLLKIKEDIERISNQKFTSVLLNLYRDGSDSNGWHSDDEKELGKHPFIASLSFGANRIFHFKHRQDPRLKFKIALEHGSLLLMGGATQEFWKHQIPKTKRKLSPRINLTFRQIKEH
ncbi:MAG: alkylated DNA repair dioxygenase AlkB [Saprospiraceae bacterium]|jgi:alkylated DNA repair dioxygenase AlkB